MNVERVMRPTGWVRVLMLLAALASCAGSAAADTGGTWVPHSNLNIARQECGTARIGKRIYVAGGLLDVIPFTSTDTVEVLDTGVGTWTLTPPMPARRDHCAVAATGGRLYVIGGYLSFATVQRDVFRFDPETRSWAQAAPLPQRLGAPAAVAHQGRIYVFGGMDLRGQPTAATFIYDPEGDAWTSGASMPTPREHLVAVSAGEYVYVLGGRDGFGELHHHGSSTAIEDRSTSLPVNERYHPATDTWTALRPMPTARSAMGAAAFGRRIVVAGGEVPQLYEVNEVYDIASDTWACHAPMSLARHGLVGVTFEDRVLMPAGGTIQGVEPTTLVDAFVPPPAFNGDPNGFAIVVGAREQGALSDLFHSDDHHLIVAPQPAATAIAPVARVEIEAATTETAPAKMTLTVETATDALPARPVQKLSLFNAESDAWELVDERPSMFEDERIEIDIDSDPARFIDAETGAMRLRLEWYPAANVLTTAWTIRIDQAMWTVNR